MKCSRKPWSSKGWPNFVSNVWWRPPFSPPPPPFPPSTLFFFVGVSVTSQPGARTLGDRLAPPIFLFLHPLFQSH
jgi:hypothetical protein